LTRAEAGSGGVLETVSLGFPEHELSDTRRRPDRELNTSVG
jgi:hypothetical protein